MCASAKFSDPATRWTTIEQECFAIYFAMLTFAYFLYYYRNIAQQSPMDGIMRWCAYLQSFQFMVRHIPGKQNVVADSLSRFMFLFRPLDIDYAEGEEEAEQLGAHILAVMDQQEEDIDRCSDQSFSCLSQRTHWTFWTSPHVQPCQQAFPRTWNSYPCIHGACSNMCYLSEISLGHG